MDFQFAEKYNVYPVLAPADIVATGTGTQYVDMKLVQWASFYVQFGAVTTGTLTVTVEASTAGSSNATEVSVPFRYRLSSAVATNAWGAITAATTTGASVATDADNKALLVDVDPASLPVEAGADYRYVRIFLQPSTDMAACLVGATAILAPRYPGNAIPTSS